MVESPSRRDVEHLRALADRILASNQLNRSIRLSKLFQYLCDRVLDDDVQEIHELELGQKVFGRAPRYDTMADNIVRVHASMLRKRLAEYFRTEGADEEYIVEIPRGNYAPIFRRRAADEVIAAPQQPTSAVQTLPPIPSIRELTIHSVDDSARALEAAPEVHKVQTSDKKLWAAIAVAAAFAILSCVLYIRLQHVRTTPASSTVLPPTVGEFWSTIFSPATTTDVVMDDASLGLYEEATHQSIPIGKYFDRSYMRNLTEGQPSADPNWHQLLLRRQSNYAASSLVWKLAQIAGTQHGQAHLQFAREVTFQQTKLDNLVLLGTPSTNPWIQLFQGALALSWAFDPATDTYYPVDETTPDGATHYKPADVSGTHDGYATISYLGNLNGTGKTLIISGSGAAATDAALHWLLQPNSFQQLRSKLLRSSTGVFPPFEVLLRIEKGMDHPRNTSIAICRPVHDSARTAQK